MGDVTTAKVMMVVKFRSRLSADEIERRYKARIPEFRQVSGLVQKYYIYDESSGEWGGIYLWDSEESVERYLASDLRKSIPSTYEVEEMSQITLKRGYHAKKTSRRETRNPARSKI